MFMQKSATAGKKFGSSQVRSKSFGGDRNNDRSFRSKDSGESRKPFFYGTLENRGTSPRSDQRPTGGGFRPSNGGQRPNSGGYRQSGSGQRPINNRRRMGENIDINKFIKRPSDTQVAPVIIENKFSDFDLVLEIHKNLLKKGYTIPTPIQDQTIKHIIEGRDIIGLANTGTGKTAAFLLPFINKVFRNRREKVLIMAPTRELALQIDTEFRHFSWDMKIFSVACVGGTPIHKQIMNLRRSPNFVIGTPGRLKDLSDRGMLKFSDFNNVVLDEVDRMLDMGFIDEIKDILGQLQEPRQSLFFSATMPMKIKDLVNKFSKDPITVSIEVGETARNVDQDVVRVRDRAMKFLQLQELLNKEELEKVLIFAETKREVEKLTKDLIIEGFKAESIHGDKRQGQRQQALKLFKQDFIDILVATDVAARGLDINDVSHVINYTVPQTYNDYIHRIGRTGRGNKKGHALTFVDAR